MQGINKRFGAVAANADVNLRVTSGTVHGIVGENGAGKSTLLKLIAGVIQPTAGELHVRGSRLAILDLSVGLNEELSARDNVLQQLGWYGLSRQQALDRMDGIIDFAELSHVLDRPIKTFSTGMKVRLGFSVLTSMSPDILLVENYKTMATLGLVDTLLAIGLPYFASAFAIFLLRQTFKTIPREREEAARIDGASRWERIRYVIIPHLAPLATFVALVQLMDNFRVFEPIVGFSAESNASSLSWLIFNDLSGDAQLFGSAGATSVLTIVGVVILLMPVLKRTWQEFNRKVV